MIEQPGLFPALPAFPAALPADELALLASLPEYGENECVQEIEPHEEAPCRRLEKRGLVKVHRWKDDPCAMSTTMYAGKLPEAGVRSAS
jgi:hypothetical protein